MFPLQSLYFVIFFSTFFNTVRLSAQELYYYCIISIELKFSASCLLTTCLLYDASEVEMTSYYVLLQASLDEPTQSVVMHRTEPSRLQSLALQLAEKMASLVDQNERLLEMKTAGPGYFNYQRPGVLCIFCISYLSPCSKLCLQTCVLPEIRLVDV